MPISSFDREIILGEEAVKKLIDKIEYDKTHKLKRKRIDINKKLEESQEMLKQIFKNK